jgi:uncharacterized DUF497 family protein
MQRHLQRHVPQSLGIARLIVISHVDRGATIRSARVANRRERKAYETGQQ